MLDFRLFAGKSMKHETSIYRGNRDLKFDRCMEECSKGEIDVPVTKLREK